MPNHNSFFFVLPVTGEFLVEALKKAGIDLPDDAVLIKTHATHQSSYCFEFMFHSPSRGWETPEGNVVAWMERR